MGTSQESDDFWACLPTAGRSQGVNDQASKIPSTCVKQHPEEHLMNTIIYIVGLVVIIGVVLSYFGLR